MEESLYHVVATRASEIARYSVEEQYRVRPSWTKYGNKGYARALEDARFHVVTIASALGLGSEELLRDYFLWLDALFGRLGFPPESAREALVTAGRAIEETLRPDEDVSAFVAAALDRQTPIAEVREPLAGDAAEYLTRLLEGDRERAVAHVASLNEAGKTLVEIYGDVLIPAQRELGSLWHEGKISAGQEHYGTAITQLALARLYGSFFTGEKKRLSMVAAAVSGELHELPIRFVADVFEANGWTTRYYGANTPLESLVGEIGARKPDLVCLSSTMPFNACSLKDYVEAVRERHDARILVGGRPFSRNEGLATAIGADGSAPDAFAAVELAGALVGGRARG